jgi:two-component system, NarL family, invasion response regulator UvrY
MTAKKKTESGKIRVFIAESQAIFRCGVQACLADTPDMVSIGHVEAGPDVPGQVVPDWCDVVLMDAGLPGLEGFAVLSQIREICPRLPVLLMSSGTDVGWLLRGIRAGALGVVSKDASPDEFRSAIRRVSEGHPYIAEPLAERLILFYQRNEKEPLDERLSPREFEVMQLISSGLKLSEIARRLHLSHQTITTHRRHILEKTGLRTTAEIIRYGILNGLGAPEDEPRLNTG